MNTKNALLRIKPYLLIVFGLFLLIEVNLPIVAGLFILIGIIMIVNKIWPDNW